MISLFKYSIILLVLIIILALMSCGTSKIVLDADEFNSFQRLGVAPYIYSGLPKDFPQTDLNALITVCDDTLLANLKQLKHIKEVTKIINDTLYTRYSKNDTAIFEYAKIRHIDVLLFCSIRYQKYSYMFIPTIISETRILCIDVKNRKTVVDLRYNNRNDVGVNETYENTTKLSINGAVSDFIKSLNKN